MLVYRVLFNSKYIPYRVKSLDHDGESWRELGLGLGNQVGGVAFKRQLNKMRA